MDWASLERPLHLPVLTASASCPVSAARQVIVGTASAAGSGPVYAVSGGAGGLATGVDGDRRIGKVLWLSDSAYSGPVLIRGRQLDGTGDVQFGSGETATDPEMRLRENGAYGGQPAGWREWPSETSVPGPGCYAWQVDGSTFSDVIVFEVR